MKTQVPTSRELVQSLLGRVKVHVDILKTEKINTDT